MIAEISAAERPTSVPRFVAPIEPELYEHLMQLVSDGVYVVDRDRKVLLWNARAEEMTGRSAQDVIGNHCADRVLKHCDSSGEILCGKKCPMAATMRDGKPRSIEAYFLHKEGRRVPVEVRSSPIRDEFGAIIGCAELFTDLSDRNALLERLDTAHDHARTDPLTGIANRRYLDELLSSIGGRRNDSDVGFIFVDIDHFKRINDTWGHDVGDRVLVQVARTIRDVVRSFDTVGRWGGEELVVIAPDTKLTEAVALAERIRAVVGQIEVDVANEMVRPTVSIGVTTLRNHECADDAMGRADQLMYESKRNGRNRVTAGSPYPDPMNSWDRTNCSASRNEHARSFAAV